MPVYTYTSFDDPFALSGTQAVGINATGQIVGSYSNAGGTHGFLYSNGTYTILDDPLANLGTVASGINAADLIVGSYAVNSWVSAPGDMLLIQITLGGLRQEADS